MQSNSDFAATIWRGIASSQPDTIRKRIADGTMTQQIWDALDRAQRDAVRDESDLHPKLKGLEGWRVAVTYHADIEASVARADALGGRHGRMIYPKTFIVGRSTGWKPIHLAMRSGARGSSRVIGADYKIVAVRKLEKVR